MELRHLRYFIAVAEELYFAHAAESLHIEQSPLSRAIKDLEYDLAAQLFERTTRSTRLTMIHPNLITLFARCRAEDPEVEIRISEMPFSQQVKELHSDLLDVGFALATDVGEGLRRIIAFDSATPSRPACPSRASG